MATKETPQDRFIKERIEKVAYWKRQLETVHKIVTQLQLDLERAEAEAKALAARAGIRVVD
jgi:hypothetical protein